MLLAALGKNNWFPGVLSTELLELSQNSKITKEEEEEEES
jgi:hypothetical protein